MILHNSAFIKVPSFIEPIATWLCQFLILTSLTCLLNPKTSFAESNQEHHQILTIGEQIYIPIHSQLDITNSNGKVLQIKDLGSNIRVKAKALGEALVTQGRKAWSFQVINKKLRETQQRLQTAISKMKGLNLKVLGKKCFLKGQLLRWKDWSDIQKIQYSSAKSCLWNAEIYHNIYEVVEQNLKKEFEKHLLQNFHIDLKTKKVFLEKERDYKEFKKYIASWGLVPIHSKRHIGLKPMIAVELFFIEAHSSWQRQLGIKFPSGAKASLLPKLVFDQDLSLEFKALESEGQGQILASPHLITFSGGKSSFHAGGEIPIRSLSLTADKDVTWKKHGIVLTIQPVADSRENISMKLSTEVSMVDFASSVEGVPGFKVNRLNSEFNLENNQVILLSGLIQSVSGESSEGLPFLQKIPILGHLFKSSSFLESKSELLIFVKPSILKANNSEL